MKKNRLFIGLITVFVVIIGMCGIGWLTFHVGRMFVGLVSTSAAGPSTEPESGNSRVLDLPDICLYTCQSGVFLEKENAGLQMEFLRQRGWQAAVITEEPYAIAIGCFFTKDEGIDFSRRLADAEINTWLKEESFPALHYKVNGRNAEEAIRILRLSNSLLRGGARDAVQKEYEEAGALLTNGCPESFAKLNGALTAVFPQDHNHDLNGDFNDDYGQDILNLYVEYKRITTKYFDD